jgi:hypothetical protein
MTENSSQHAYVTWTKQRLDEMDAALASIEAKASQLEADSKAKATQLNADMKKRRADFEAEVKANLKAGETALQASKTQLEKHWASFEAELKTYVETVGKDIDQKRATFADIAAAQAKAWGEAVEKLQSAAAELGAENRAKVDKAIAQVRADTTEAKAHLEELKQAGEESWAALSAALQTSRKKFDEASQSAWEALKNSVPTIKS